MENHDLNFDLHFLLHLMLTSPMPVFVQHKAQGKEVYLYIKQYCDIIHHYERNA